VSSNRSGARCGGEGVSCEHKWIVEQCYTYEASKPTDTICLVIVCEHCQEERSAIIYGYEPNDVDANHCVWEVTT
jgi:hypothetical protein